MKSFREWMNERELAEAQTPEVIKYNKIKKLKTKIQDKKIVRFLDENLSLKYNPKEFAQPYKDTSYSIKKLSSDEIDIIHYKNTVELTSGYIQLDKSEPYCFIFSDSKKSMNLSFVKADDDKAIKSLTGDLKILGDIFKVLEFNSLDIFDNFIKYALKEIKNKNVKSIEKIDFEECVDILYKNISGSKNKETYLINHSDVREFLNNYTGYMKVKNMAEFKSKIKDLDHIIELIRNED